MDKSPFQPALDEMVKSKALFFGPTKWREYLKDHIPAEERDNYGRTAQFVSVQSLNDLDSTLRRLNTMVFRTGFGSFGLVRSSSINDFFLVDETFDAPCEFFFPLVPLATCSHFNF